MTDEQIIKALECCNKFDNGKGCFLCPYRQYCPDCLRRRNEDTIDLINRQNAEIESFKISHSQFISDINAYKEKLKTAKAEAKKEFAERLKAKFNCMEYVIKTSRKTMPVERVKAEVDAVLRNGCLNIIDKILKEVTGES